MKNVHDEKEKLMNELFGKSKAYDINDTLNTLNSIENELNNLIAKNNNDIDGSCLIGTIFLKDII